MKTLKESIRSDLDALNEIDTFADDELSAEHFNSPEEFMNAVKKIPFDKLVALMGRYSGYEAGFHPSTWDAVFKDIPYPGYLAQALVKSESAESVTDLGNVYYYSRKLSKEAHDIFAAHASSTDTTLQQLAGTLPVEDIKVDARLTGIMKNEPGLWEDIMSAQLSDQQYRELKQALLTSEY